MPFNGPATEPNPDLPDGVVYCVQCGNIFVFHPDRDCPTCELHKMVQELME